MQQILCLLASIFLLACNERGSTPQSDFVPKPSKPREIAASITKDLTTSFVPSSSVNDAVGDIILNEGEKLKLEIKVSGKPSPTIEWFYSPYFSDYDLRKGTPTSSDSIEKNIFQANVSLNVHGYYWAKVYNKLNINNPVYSKRVKVDVNSDNAPSCSPLNHGFEYSSLFHKAPFVPFGNSCEPIFVSSICINGELLSQDHSELHRYCQVEEEICTDNTIEGCEVFESVSLISRENKAILDYNNPVFELNCPADYLVKLFKSSKDGSYFRSNFAALDSYSCTGSPISIQVVHPDGAYTLTLKPFLKTNPGGMGAKIKKQNLTLAGSSAYASISIDSVMNIDSAEDLSVKKSFIDNQISQNVMEHFPRPFDLVELFIDYMKDGVSTWNSNTLTQNLDFSGVGWNTTHAGTLVTNQLIMTAKHWEHPHNSVIVFHDPAGNRFERKVVDVERAGGDISVQYLDEPLPDSVKVYKMLSWKTNLIWGAPLILTNQRRQVGLAKSEFVLQGTTSLRWNSWHLTDELKPAGLRLISGDSGNPIFIVSEGELVLLGHPTSTNLGPNYSSRIQQEKIQMAIEILHDRH